MQMNIKDYENKFSWDFITKMNDAPESLTLTDVLENMYGFTFTDQYAKCEIPDEFFMDYWDEKLGPGSLQAKALFAAIDSTGDGLTPETAFCVIDVHQEYEFIKRNPFFRVLRLVGQRCSNGIDSIEFRPNIKHIDRLYFDISRRFEVGYTFSK